MLRLQASLESSPKNGSSRAEYIKPLMHVRERKMKLQAAGARLKCTASLIYLYRFDLGRFDSCPTFTQEHVSLQQHHPAWGEAVRSASRGARQGMVYKALIATASRLHT